MISEDVLTYVRNALAQGAVKSAVEQELIKAGWTSEQVAQIFEQASTATPVASAVPPRLESLANPVTSPSSMSTIPSDQPVSTNTGNAPKKSSSLGTIIIVLMVLLILGGGGVYVYMQQSRAVVPEVESTSSDATNNAGSGQQDLVDQRNAFDAAIDKPVLSDGQRLGSVLHQFSAIVPKGWGILATSSDGYLHFDVINAQSGAAGGVIRVSRYLTLYPETITLKEIADKERQDLKARAEGFTEKDFTTATIAGREVYVIKAGSTFNNAEVEITAYLFLDKGRYYIVTGITAGDSTTPDFAATLAAVVQSFEIAAI